HLAALDHVFLQFRHQGAVGRFLVHGFGAVVIVVAVVIPRATTGHQYPQRRRLLCAARRFHQQKHIMALHATLVTAVAIELPAVVVMTYAELAAAYPLDAFDAVGNVACTRWWHVCRHRCRHRSWCWHWGRRRFRFVVAVIHHYRPVLHRT